MKLTKENYFSSEADKFYMSVSQYNSFNGVPVKMKCEAMAMAKFKGEWVEEPTTPMLIGSYVDAYFDESLEDFKKEKPQIFTQKGELRAEFKKAEEIIQFAEQDSFFMDYIKGEGESQVIVTGEIGGCHWKGKIDRLHRGKAIVDLKVVASIRDLIWIDYEKRKLNFIDAYGYINQGAVYQELYYQMSGERLPFYIAAITKEKVPDKEIFHINDEILQEALKDIKINLPSVFKIKSKELPPVECGVCDYCKSVKKLEKTILFVSDIYL